MSVHRRASGPAWLGLLLLAGVGLTACTEELTTPGSCPGTCPGGAVEIKDTVIEATVGRDSAYAGYVMAGDGSGLLVTTAEPTDQYLAAMRFGGRPDSVRVNDTLKPYTIDSVALTLGVTGRDPTVIGVVLQLYRAPVTIDSTSTFADLAGYAVPANFIDSIVVPDTLTTGNVRVVLAGADLAKVAIPPGDSGVLALVVGMTAASPTGVVLGSGTAATYLPQFITYPSVAGVDSTKQPNPIIRVPTEDLFAEQNPPVAGPDELILGGAPSSRILLRFPVDSGSLIGLELLRAELLLVPSQPIQGVPGISGDLVVRGVLSDQGAKSPLVPSILASSDVTAGSSDTVAIEVLNLVKLWQAPSNAPKTAFFLSLQPEASTFTRPIFFSTASAGGGARLRITYATTLDFEEP